MNGPVAPFRNTRCPQIFGTIHSDPVRAKGCPIKRPEGFAAELTAVENGSAYVSRQGADRAMQPVGIGRENHDVVPVYGHNRFTVAFPRALQFTDIQLDGDDAGLHVSSQGYGFRHEISGPARSGSNGEIITALTF